MDKSDENKKSGKDHNNNAFLKEDPNKEGKSYSHQSYLGLSTPSRYFSKSKNDILSALSSTEKAEPRPTFILNPMVKWAIAASVAILIGAGAFLIYQKTISKHPAELTESYQMDSENSTIESDDLLITSLFIDDSTIDQYVDDYLMNTIFSDIVFVDPEDVIINSLMIEDSALDMYIDDYLIEELIF